ncbi:hypothetical protein NLG97_g4770 [Lecanicillium saksenae]|uniref:Uncharacterized protein n=1 Tax=Lecanicillium saksenae TaxID=468837 RepID=A0ACC1QWX2_9HYPO|nr:hypothetical protein NLG97_g4770 [Lecanicillium saksenae]
MATTDPLLGANFLSDAAHLLREAAPETSAYLMNECADHLSRQGASVSDIYRQSICTGCGYIMIPGQATELKLEARRISAKKNCSLGKQVAAASPSGPCKTLTCGHCKSITRIRLSAPEKASRSKAPKKATELARGTTSDKAKPTTTNASSKKRAKNRKAGLQALLSSQQKPSGGLSLASFMK